MKWGGRISSELLHFILAIGGGGGGGGGGRDKSFAQGGEHVAYTQAKSRRTLCEQTVWGVWERAEHYVNNNNIHITCDSQLKLSRKEMWL